MIIKHLQSIRLLILLLVGVHTLDAAQAENVCLSRLHDLSRLEGFHLTCAKTILTWIQATPPTLSLSPTSRKHRIAQCNWEISLARYLENPLQKAPQKTLQKQCKELRTQIKRTLKREPTLLPLEPSPDAVRFYLRQWPAYFAKK